MILVVDDDPSFLTQAAASLAAMDRDRKISLASNGMHAMDLSSAAGADLSLAFVDLDLPDLNGFDLIARLKRTRPDLPIIAISGVIPVHVLESAKAFGADEVLSKPITAKWAATAERVREKHLSSSGGRLPSTTALGSLTPREMQVLRLIATGLSTREIAAQLGVSFKTLCAHRSRIMAKLGAHEVTALVRYAIRTGMIQP
jgi:DNA-binding NarL/FixJ family response regulator